MSELTVEQLPIAERRYVAIREAVRVSVITRCTQTK